MKMVRVFCKKIPLYSQWQLQEADFLYSDGGHDGNGKWQ